MSGTTKVEEVHQASVCPGFSFVEYLQNNVEGFILLFSSTQLTLVAYTVKPHYLLIIEL